MLILTRKSGQTIVIGGGIQVKVLEIRGNRVRIGIDAPADVHIVRAELPNVAQPPAAAVVLK